jgi:hypothetical protein
MSALPPKADIAERDCHVRFVPKADKVQCNEIGADCGSAALYDHDERGFLRNPHNLTER